MSITTPPPSNLGPMSEPWARFRTAQAIQNAEAIESMGGDASNDGRINNSAMDNMAFQINELQDRQSGFVTVPDEAVPLSSGIGTITVSIQLPRTDVTRVGWVAVQFTATTNTAAQTGIYGSFDIDGRVFHRDSRAVPSQALEPASWNGAKAITGYTGFVASPDGGGLVRLTLQYEAIGTGARTVTFSGIQATYQYGQRA